MKQEKAKDLNEKIEAKHAALSALREAERAMHFYATKCDIGCEREKAFNCYENIRRAFIDA